MPKLSTLKKSLDILLLFSEDCPTLDVPTITKSLDIPPSTVYRYIDTLKDEGLIEEDTKPGRYRLGVKVLELAQIAKQQMDIIAMAYPVMEWLSDQTEETIVLATLREQRVTGIEKIDGRHNLRVSYERGRSQYLHAGASAKVIMAYLTDKERESIIKEVGLPELTENTITDPNRLEAELKKIRKNGFALSDGEVDPGVRAIAAPIFDGHNKVMASISIGGPIDRIKGKEKKRAIELIIKAGEKITRKVKKYGL